MSVQFISVLTLTGVPPAAVGTGKLLPTVVVDEVTGPALPDRLNSQARLTVVDMRFG